MLTLGRYSGLTSSPLSCSDSLWQLRNTCWCCTVKPRLCCKKKEPESHLGAVDKTQLEKSWTDVLLCVCFCTYVCCQSHSLFPCFVDCSRWDSNHVDKAALTLMRSIHLSSINPYTIYEGSRGVWALSQLTMGARWVPHTHIHTSTDNIESTIHLILPVLRKLECPEGTPLIKYSILYFCCHSKTPKML